MRLKGKSFGIMTPLTTQRASFEKNHISNSRPIIKGKFFYIKYQTLHDYPFLKRTPLNEK